MSEDVYLYKSCGRDIEGCTCDRCAIRVFETREDLMDIVSCRAAIERLNRSFGQISIVGWLFVICTIMAIIYEMLK